MLVIAAEDDEAAAAAVRSWNRTQEVRLLTPRDLSHPGWSHDPVSPETGRLVAGGDHLRVADLRAVYTRLSAVRASHLPFVRTADRAYAAEEMHAFLVAWLTALPCPVVNNATPQCLCGPAWPWEQWAVLATRLGLRIAAGARSSDEPDGEAIPPGSGILHILDRRTLEDNGPLGESLAALAQQAGIDAMSAIMTPPDTAGERTLRGCSPWVNLQDPRVADELLRILVEGPAE